MKIKINGKFEYKGHSFNGVEITLNGVEETAETISDKKLFSLMRHGLDLLIEQKERGKKGS